MQNKFQPGDIVIWTDGKAAKVRGYISVIGKIVSLEDGSGIQFSAGESELRFPDVHTVNHAYEDDGSDPGNCSVCHFFHR